MLQLARAIRPASRQHNQLRTIIGHLFKLFRESHIVAGRYTNFVSGNINHHGALPRVHGIGFAIGECIEGVDLVIKLAASTACNEGGIVHAVDGFPVDLHRICGAEHADDDGHAAFVGKRGDFFCEMLGVFVGITVQAPGVEGLKRRFWQHNELRIVVCGLGNFIFGQRQVGFHVGSRGQLY